jgi:hypothetical protein
MSQRVCVYTGIKRSDLATCGGLCAAFPECLPPLPRKVQAEFAGQLVAGVVEARALLAFLTNLHSALDDGHNDDCPGQGTHL